MTDRSVYPGAWYAYEHDNRTSKSMKQKLINSGRDSKPITIHKRYPDWKGGKEEIKFSSQRTLLSLYKIQWNI